MTTSLTSSPQDCKHLDIDSVKAICGDSRQAMVFGWGHCKYNQVFDVLEKMCSENGSPVKKVFDWTVGRPEFSGEDCMTLEGRAFNVIHYADTYRIPQVTSRPCKTAMTNLVLENVKRLRMKETPIPLIFCHDIDDNPKPFKPTDMISKDPKLNAQYSHKELRRAYKLCTHENEEIRNAALATFKFVRLKNIGKETYALERIAAPWDAPLFSLSWEARKSISSSQPKSEHVNWRKQLERHVDKIHFISVAGLTITLPKSIEERSPTSSDSSFSPFSLASTPDLPDSPITPDTPGTPQPTFFSFAKPKTSPQPAPASLNKPLTAVLAKTAISLALSAVKNAVKEDRGIPGVDQ